jgi:hypothetical protein
MNQTTVQLLETAIASLTEIRRSQPGDWERLSRDFALSDYLEDIQSANEVMKQKHQFSEDSKWLISMAVRTLNHLRDRYPEDFNELDRLGLSASDSLEKLSVARMLMERKTKA